MMDVVDGGAMTAPLMVPAGSNGTEASLLSGSDMGMQGGGGFQMTMINGGGRSNNSPADGSGCSGSGGDYGGLSAQDQLNIASDNGGQDAEADARNAGEDAGDDADTSNGGESADDTDDLIVPAADEHGQLIAVQRKKHQPKGNVRRTKGHQVFPAWSAAPRVLVVEDNIVSRKLSARILQLIGCNIETAVNGQEAVAKMGSGKYDLCLMDINMPSLSGVDATTRIRSFDINTPIISMSSTRAPNAVAGYLSVGMNDYLPKPFNKHQLFNMLQKHLHHMLNNFRRLSHQIPPVVGMPPLSDNGITEAVAHAAAAVTPESFDANGNLHLGQNPLAAMGISDDVYAGMVQSFYSTNGVLGDNNGGSLANFAMYPQSGAGLPFLGQFDASNGGSGGGEGGGNGQKRKAGDFENEWDDSKRIRVEELP
jgi:CheY-like chemotaxis protein